MNDSPKKHRHGNSEEGSELIGYQCPCCNMLVWHHREFKGEVFCPFCCHGQPGYLTKISRETMVIWNEKPQKNQQRRKAEDEKPTGASPFINEFFMVQGMGFRCMAYRNGDGKWRGAFDNEELPGKVRVLE